MKILIVEPDEYYHSALLELIGPLGEVVISKDGKDLFSLIEESPPDAVVMELLLPKISGFEVLTLIRQKFPNSTIPVIVYSAVRGLEDIEAALAFGVSGYFVKGQDSMNDVKKLLLNLAK